MDDLIGLLGSELYQTVTDKLCGKRILIDDGKLIPKHRFDCINLSLKDHKQQIAELRTKICEQAERIKVLENGENRAEELERTVCILTELSKHKVKNIQTVLPLLHLDGLSDTELKDALIKQIRALKRSDAYLFTTGNELYKLVPVHGGRNKSEADK